VAYEPFTFGGEKTFDEVVAKNTTINGTLDVSDDVALSNTTINGTLDVTGDVTAPNVSTRLFALGDQIRGTAPTWESNNTVNMPALRCLNSTRAVEIATSSATLNFATTGLNGLDTGSLVANTWYYIWAILNPTTGATGFLASTSSTSPTMPSGFTVRRLLPFPVRTWVATATLRPFVMTHDAGAVDCFWGEVTSEMNLFAFTNNTDTVVNLDLTCPPGYSGSFCRAYMNIERVIGSTSTGSVLHRTGDAGSVLSRIWLYGGATVGSLNSGPFLLGISRTANTFRITATSNSGAGQIGIGRGFRLNYIGGA
jgi:hypothetical protein